MRKADAHAYQICIDQLSVDFVTEPSTNVVVMPLRSSAPTKVRGVFIPLGPRPCRWIIREVDRRIPDGRNL
jgi:hypothetical protein